jgi:hypothetical protein
MRQLREDLRELARIRIREAWLLLDDGKYLCGLLDEGDEPGQFDRPHGLTLDSAGCLYVADTMNQRIQKFTAD